MYEKFTDRARRVMILANQEAQRLHHEYVGTEHILLGLVKEGTGIAACVLGDLGVDLRKIRLEVEKLVQNGHDMVTMGKLPQTPRVKKVIEYSLTEARSLGHDYLGTEHILLGLLREPEGIAGQVLMSLGLKLDEVREVALTLLGYGKPANHLEAAEQLNAKAINQIRPGTSSGVFVLVTAAIAELISHLNLQNPVPAFTIPPTKDCGVHDLVKKMQVSETPDFCWSCGANKPPITGEGTCPACDTFGFLRNPQLSDTDKLVALVAEAKRRGFIIGPLGTSTGAPGPSGASGAQGCCGSIPCTLAHSCPFDPGPPGDEGVDGEGPVADFRPRGEVAMEVLRTLNGIRKLGDYTYDIREREGLGWDGPQTKAWSDACAKAERLLDS